ncbi:chemotaxis protein CheW [Halorussus salilacus]|uniref:chemotaxis protein CheW n=1 Tax=Halorussus salilacus TaxID=2953750 RepID=UPI00209DD1CD|nr:chemotaxis protein CheW [Halorussus salilacus]USZ68135.1 chemotaxis protein CheW [Halorussus salilacus]
MEAQETDPTASDAPGDDEEALPVEAHDVETRQVVEFRLGEDYCAVDIDEVDGIVEIKKVTRIPRTPDPIDGVMDLRGETTAIIDPREFLGVEGEAPDTDDQNVLVLDRADDKQKIGIRVDEVLEVATYAEDRIDTDDDISNLETRGIEERVSRGIIRKPQAEDEVEGDALDLVVWVDIDAVIDQLK